MKSLFHLILVILFVSALPENVKAQGALLDYSKTYNESVFGILRYPPNISEADQLGEVLSEMIDGLSIYVEMDKQKNTPVIKANGNTSLTLEETLSEIRQILESDSQRIFTLFLDYDSDLDLNLITTNFSSAALAPYTYVKNGDDWATLEDMSKTNKRLVVFTLKENPNNPYWMHYLWDHATEPYYASNDDDYLFDRQNPFRGGVDKDLLVYDKFQEYESSQITWAGVTEAVDVSNGNGANGVINVSDGVEMIREVWLSTGKKPNFFFVKEVGVFDHFKGFLRSFKSIKGSINTDSRC